MKFISFNNFLILSLSSKADAESLLNQFTIMWKHKGVHSSTQVQGSKVHDEEREEIEYVNCCSPALDTKPRLLRKFPDEIFSSEFWLQAR